MPFKKEDLLIDPKLETEKIVAKLRTNLARTLKKRGAVVGVSGGLDSSVVLALCVKAFGKEKVLAIMMPEEDSSPDSLVLARQLANQFQVGYVVENITAALKGFDTYARRDQAIKEVFPDYNNNFKAKITLPSGNFEADSINFYNLTLLSPDGEEFVKRLPLKQYLQIVAASNFKQRSRMSMLYYHADAQNFAVIGTGNKNEHEMGFFVKYGDGGADVKPIAHLFKTQVFQLADHLNVPETIRKRVPTTDTYSAEQTQEEFFFNLPFDLLDPIWYGWEKGVEEKEIASAVDLDARQVQNIIKDLQRKIAATEYLRLAPL